MATMPVPAVSQASKTLFLAMRRGKTTAPAKRTLLSAMRRGRVTAPVWIEGDIGTTTFKVNGRQVAFVLTSSRTLKKNIRPYRNFDKALEDILKTPLFTYEYKKDHPEKSRMGIIAEELPRQLRLKDKKGLAYTLTGPAFMALFGPVSKLCMK